MKQQHRSRHSTRETFERSNVDHFDSPARQHDDSLCLTAAQDAIDRWPPRARKVREVLLNQGHDDRFAVPLEHSNEFEEAPPHPPIGGHVERVDEGGRLTAHFGNEGVGDDVIGLWRAFTKLGEVRSRQTHRLGVVVRNNRAGPRAWSKHGEFPEMFSRAHHSDRRDVAERRRDANREMTFDNQVDRVTRVAIVEDDLVALETPPPRLLQHNATLLFVECREHLEFDHRSSMASKH